MRARRAGFGSAAMAALAAPHERDAFGLSLSVNSASSAVRQVRALSHPGLLVIRRQYNLKDKRFPQAISVEEVRRLRAFLGHRGGEGAWRVVIVDSADELNINAANALLKSLEEPPERTLFLLVTSEPGRLLATIRSRCRTLDLNRLASNDLAQAVSQALAAAGREMPEAQATATLMRLADGSARRFLSLEAGGGLRLYEDIYGLLAGLPTVAWPKVHELADTLAPATAEVRFNLFFELLLELLARVVRAAATGSGAVEDQRLAERILRRGDFSWFGLIGSHTKRRAFEQRLGARGIDAAALSRMECPIGVAGIRDKHPAAIAISVAARILRQREAGASTARPALHDARA